jgi:hypothetical protein
LDIHATRHPLISIFSKENATGRFPVVFIVLLSGITGSTCGVFYFFEKGRPTK